MPSLNRHSSCSGRNGCRPSRGSPGNRLDGIIVGDQRGQAALVHPAQQALVAAVEDGAGRAQRLESGSPPMCSSAVGEAGVQADHVAASPRSPAAPRRLAPDRHSRRGGVAGPKAACRSIITAAALDAGRGHVLDAQAAGSDRSGQRGRIAGRGVAQRRRPRRHGSRCSRPARRCRPRRRRTRRRRGTARPIASSTGSRAARHRRRRRRSSAGRPAQRVVVVPLAAALCGHQLRRVAPRVELVAAGTVERQAEAEDDALAGLGQAPPHLLRRQQVQPPALIIGPELAPVRSVRSLPPAHRQVLPPPALFACS